MHRWRNFRAAGGHDRSEGAYRIRRCSRARERVPRPARRLCARAGVRPSAPLLGAVRFPKMGLIISLFDSVIGSWMKMDARLCMVGLDAAGKTTILYKLKLGEVVTTIPTIGFNVEAIEYGNLTLTVWDIGGQDKIRPLWRHYYSDTQGVIFVVDANDTERFGMAKDELHGLLEQRGPSAPFLFYGGHPLLISFKS
jgi:hypothetical protein